jgi:hypothetical protein
MTSAIARNGQTLAIAAVVAAALLASGAGASPAPHLPIVPCGDAIGHHATGTTDGYRTVLGVVSVPPAYLAQVVRSGQAPMRWWRKAGMIVRSGSPPVTLTVPQALHNELEITWGNANRQGSALRFAACPSYGRPVWNAYAGGFLLRERAACASLIVTVGRRLATIRFGIGTHCH